MLLLAFVFLRDPVSVPMEVLNSNTIKMKKERMRADKIYTIVSVGGYGSESSIIIDTYQQAAEYLGAFTDSYFDFGIYLSEETKETSVVLSNSLGGEILIPIDNNTLPTYLARDMLKESKKIMKVARKAFLDLKNPEKSQLKAKIEHQTKLIKTAVDKEDLNRLKKEKEELEGQFKTYVSDDKKMIKELKKQKKGAKSPEEKAQIKQKIEELKNSLPKREREEIEIVKRNIKGFWKEMNAEVEKLDPAEETKKLIQRRKDMARYQEEDDEEEDGMLEIMKAAAEVADDEKSRKEYADKAIAIEKLKKLKERERQKRKARREKGLPEDDDEEDNQEENIESIEENQEAKTEPNDEQKEDEEEL